MTLSWVRACEMGPPRTGTPKVCCVSITKSTRQHMYILQKHTEREWWRKMKERKSSESLPRVRAEPDADHVVNVTARSSSPSFLPLIRISKKKK